MPLHGSSGSLKSLVEAFFAYLKRQNRAASTIKRWRPDLAQLVSWVGERGLSEIGGRDLGLDFLTVWERNFEERNGRPPAPNTMRAIIQAITSFYAFAEKFGYLEDENGLPFRNPALALEPPTIRPVADLDWLRDEEDQAMLAAPRNEREYILVFFLRIVKADPIVDRWRRSKSGPFGGAARPPRVCASSGVWARDRRAVRPSAGPGAVAEGVIGQGFSSGLEPGRASTSLPRRR